MELENFSIFKNDKKDTEKHPDYIINTKVGEKYEKWGACWKKKTSKGDTFLSCSKNKPKPKYENGEVPPTEVPGDF